MPQLKGGVMSSQHTVLRLPEVDVFIDESSHSQFEFCVRADAEVFRSEKLDEDGIIQIVSNLLGPLYYYSDRPDDIIDKLKKRLGDQGYC